MNSVRRVATTAFALLLFAALWEIYKLVGSITGLNWPIATDDLTMPHSWDIAITLFEPVQRGGDESLAVFLLKSAFFTFREAALGFGLGTVIGLLLAIVMLRFNFLGAGLVPWINVSQTIPLIALAPIVVTWARGISWVSDPQAVALIATYLTFFPVAVNGLAGLKSPDESAVELMRSYGAPWWSTLVKLRFPAARPFLFPAFKLAATLIVVGAIVGEISSGVAGGLGRVILDFAGRYSTGPERVYAAVLAAAALGLFVFGLTAALEKIVLRGQSLEVEHG